MESNIQKLLVDRYYLEDETSWTGEEGLAKRVSGIYPPIYEDIRNKNFIPSTPTLMNANTKGKRKGTLSSCFTMDIEDSIEGIFDAVKEAALVTKSGGGVGYVFSKLRGSKENIQSLNADSSGPLPFMNVMNVTLDSLRQGGKRLGAGMGQFDISHPNILEVIRAKNQKGVLERLNLSIRVTDEFYNKLQSNPDFPHLVYTKDGTPYPLEDNGKIVSVKKLWDEIIEYAWLCAEPGIFNIDIATRQCTVTNLNPYVLSNPCAEYVNIPYSSCNLGSINLTKCIKNGKFDWVEFERLVRISTRFLDSVIDANDFPLEKIKDVTLQVRPIGLGTMAWGHMLYLLGIPFNSTEANELADELYYNLTMISMDESCNMAKELGAYPAFDLNLFIKANDRFFDNTEKKQKKAHVSITRIFEKLTQYGVRNSCFTSIAPNGSISYIAGMLTGGIEPVFALTYARKIEKPNKEYDVIYISDPIFDQYLNDNYDEKTKVKILKKIAENKGSCQTVEEIPEADRKIYVIASDLTPMEHLESLAIVAKHTSLSVSKTINLDTTATREEISEVYLKAHEMGVIGVTVYRDGCRDGILVHSSTKDDKEAIVKTNAPKRPKKLPSHVYRTNILNRVTNESEKWIMFVGLLNDEPYEIIAGKITDFDFDPSITEGEMVRTKRDGKTIYQFTNNNEIIVDDVIKSYLNELREYATRLMSLALRHGASIEYLKEVLQKSKGSIVDFNLAVVRGISKYVKDVKSKEKCPLCNSDLRYTEGCIKCSSLDCSYTKCG